MEDQSLKKQCLSTAHQDAVVEFKGRKMEERLLKEDKKVLQVVPRKEGKGAVSSTKTLRHQQIKCLGWVHLHKHTHTHTRTGEENKAVSNRSKTELRGENDVQFVNMQLKNEWYWHVFDLLCLCVRFPNPAQICYLNSCLQSLLTLEDFVRAIACQEQVWSLNPEAALMRYSNLQILPLILCSCCTRSVLMAETMLLTSPPLLSRSFMDIRGSHFSSDGRHKIRLLAAFKKAVSAWAPEFHDLHQKVSKLVLGFVLSPLPDSFPSDFSIWLWLWWLCKSAGCSRVPHLRAGADEVFGPAAADDGSQRGHNLQLSSGGSPGV